VASAVQWHEQAAVGAGVAGRSWTRAEIKEVAETNATVRYALGEANAMKAEYYAALKRHGAYDDLVLQARMEKKDSAHIALLEAKGDEAKRSAAKLEGEWTKAESELHAEMAEAKAEMRLKEQRASYQCVLFEGRVFFRDVSNYSNSRPLVFVGVQSSEGENGARD
jgi:hypothetical protein